MGNSILKGLFVYLDGNRRPSTEDLFNGAQEIGEDRCISFNAWGDHDLLMLLRGGSLSELSTSVVRKKAPSWAGVNLVERISIVSDGDLKTVWDCFREADDKMAKPFSVWSEFKLLNDNLPYGDFRRLVERNANGGLGFITGYSVGNMDYSVFAWGDNYKDLLEAIYAIREQPSDDGQPLFSSSMTVTGYLPGLSDSRIEKGIGDGDTNLRTRLHIRPGRTQHTLDYISRNLDLQGNYRVTAGREDIEITFSDLVKAHKIPLFFGDPSLHGDIARDVLYSETVVGFPYSRKSGAVSASDVTPRLPYVSKLGASGIDKSALATPWLMDLLERLDSYYGRIENSHHLLGCVPDISRAVKRFYQVQIPAVAKVKYEDDEHLFQTRAQLIKLSKSLFDCLRMRMDGDLRLCNFQAPDECEAAYSKMFDIVCGRCLTFANSVRAYSGCGERLSVIVHPGGHDDISASQLLSDTIVIDFDFRYLFEGKHSIHELYHECSHFVNLTDGSALWGSDGELLKTLAHVVVESMWNEAISQQPPFKKGQNGKYKCKGTKKEIYEAYNSTILASNSDLEGRFIQSLSDATTRLMGGTTEPLSWNGLRESLAATLESDGAYDFLNRFNELQKGVVTQFDIAAFYFDSAALGLTLKQIFDDLSEMLADMQVAIITDDCRWLISRLGASEDLGHLKARTAFVLDAVCPELGDYFIALDASSKSWISDYLYYKKVYEGFCVVANREMRRILENKPLHGADPSLLVRLFRLQLALREEDIMLPFIGGSYVPLSTRSDLDILRTALDGYCI